ncbi:MAG: FHA domain-containing protein [Planctomycetes bacterium]|nr:FHA domain-containing protein [Planctomycetota bacterium]
MEVSLQIRHGRLKSGAGVENVGAFRIPQRRFVIGRGTDCNMVCKSRLVSLRHCEIIVADDMVTLEDLHSENGTFVNGIRVEGKRRLKTGDVLKIGRLEFFVAVDANQDVPARDANAPDAAAQNARDTVAMSATASDTVISPPPSARVDKAEGIDDLVSDLLLEADEQERTLRMNDPAARYLRVESPPAGTGELDAPTTDVQEPVAEEEKRKRPARKGPIKLPTDKRPQPTNITGKDSVGAAELALEELLRSSKK